MDWQWNAFSRGQQLQLVIVCHHYGRSTGIGGRRRVEALVLPPCNLLECLHYQCIRYYE